MLKKSGVILTAAFPAISAVLLVLWIVYNGKEKKGRVVYFVNTNEQNNNTSNSTSTTTFKDNTYENDNELSDITESVYNNYKNQKISLLTDNTVKAGIFNRSFFDKRESDMTEKDLKKDFLFKRLENRQEIISEPILDEEVNHNANSTNLDKAALSDVTNEKAFLDHNETSSVRSKENEQKVYFDVLTPNSSTIYGLIFSLYSKFSSYYKTVKSTIGMSSIQEDVLVKPQDSASQINSIENKVNKPFTQLENMEGSFTAPSTVDGKNVEIDSETLSEKSEKVKELESSKAEVFLQTSPVLSDADQNISAIEVDKSNFNADLLTKSQNLDNITSIPIFQQDDVPESSENFLQEENNSDQDSEFKTHNQLQSSLILKIENNLNKKINTITEQLITPIDDPTPGLEKDSRSEENFVVNTAIAEEEPTSNILKSNLILNNSNLESDNNLNNFSFETSTSDAKTNKEPEGRSSKINSIFKTLNGFYNNRF